MHSNPQYAHVRLPSGIESTVSIRDLAPCQGATENDSAHVPPPIIHPSSHSSSTVQGTGASLVEDVYVQDEPVIFLNPVVEPVTVAEACLAEVPRRSSRVSRTPQRLIENC